MPQPTATGQKSPLDVLPAMLHAVFIQTANVFNDPRKHNPRGAVVNTNAMIKIGIPVAIDRFQYALDCLEVEILRAKATFRRDLEVLRQRIEEESRAKNERDGDEVKALEEKVTRDQQEQEQEEAKEKQVPQQVATATNVLEDRKNQKLNSGVTDFTIIHPITVSNRDIVNPTPAGTETVGGDSVVLLGDTVFGRHRQGSKDPRNNLSLFIDEIKIIRCK